MSYFDRDEIFENILKSPSSFLYLSDDLKNDVDFLIELLDGDVTFQEIEMYVPDTMKNNEQLFNELLKHGYNLKYAGVDIKKNKRLVRKAYKSDIFSLQFADVELRNNEEFIRELLAINIKGYRFIGPALKHNIPLALLAYKENLDMLRYAGNNKELLNNKDFLYELKAICDFKNIRPITIRDWMTTTLEAYEREDILRGKLIIKDTHVPKKPKI